MFQSAKWIGSTVPTNRHTLYRFRKSVTLESIEHMTASVFADSRYKLYINGHYVCEGPCVGTAAYYDTQEISAFLQIGTNVIDIAVLYIGDVKGASCINRKQRVALMFEACQDGHPVICSDDTWSCAVDSSYTFYVSPSIHPNGFLNESYCQKELVWKQAALLPFSKGHDTWGVLPYYELPPRPIPMYKPFNSAPMAISKTDMADHQSVRAGENAYIIYELGRHKVGYPEFEFCGHADVKIVYGESYVQSCNGRQVKEVRSDQRGDIIGAFDELSLREDTFLFRPFMTKTARYIKLQITALTDFQINRADFTEYRYPLAVENTFSCSNDVYNRIFQTSIHTLENCTFDTYVDCPYYEMQQYAEDAYLEMLYTLMLTSDASIPKKLITDLWQSQNYEGMQLAAAPMEYKQITPTFCFFWIMMLEKYLLYTNDQSTVQPMLPGVYAILSWFKQRINTDGIVDVYPYGKFIDWVKSWKSGFFPDGADTKPVSISSLMYLYALKCAASLFRLFRRNGVAEDLERDYHQLKNAVNRIYYDKKVGMYADTQNGAFSQHSQIWAVLSGAVEGALAQKALQACEQEHVHKCSYSYRFFKSRAYELCHLPQDMDVFLQDWKNMLALDATTWFEFPGQARSDCHAWSSVPIYEMTTKILGVTPLAAGYQSVEIAPEFGKLAHASGVVPTPHGQISVSWVHADLGTYTVTVKAPDGITLLPTERNARILSQTNENGVLTVVYQASVTL